MQHVLVTGASGGIGRAIAVALAEHGARIGVHYNSDRSGAEATCRRLPGEGHVIFRCDLSDATAASRLWDEVIKSFGHVDALVNNAGIYEEHSPLAMEQEPWNEIVWRTLTTNFLGPAQLSYCAARAMAQQRGGRIVNISSRGAFRGEPVAPAYAASKAAVNAFGQSFAKAFAPEGVLVFMVAPGWVATKRVAMQVQSPATLADQPLGRVATPEEVARVAMFCVLEAPASLTGAILDVNGASYLR